MKTILHYSTPQAYLDASRYMLEQQELDNNLILGICDSFTDKSKEYKHCVFINSILDGKIQASSVMTNSRAIISCNSKNSLHIKSLAMYYSENNLRLTNIFGESSVAMEFANTYNKAVISKKDMIVHELILLNNINLAEGILVPATYSDLDLICDWIDRFQEDVDLYPKRNPEGIKSMVNNLITSGDLFKWVKGDEILSVAAIVRKTKNIGIIGMVYTPEIERGKGYATSMVHQLSQYILEHGFKSCGLFTDKNNPTSNKIYKRIGFQPSTEFSQLIFE